MMFPKLSILLATATTTMVQGAEMTGYLMDNKCLEICLEDDGVTPKTTGCTPDGSNAYYSPEFHTGWCLLLPVCDSSGYSLMSTEPNEDGLHTQLLSLSGDEAHAAVLEYINNSNSMDLSFDKKVAFPMVTVEYEDDAVGVTSDGDVPQVMYATVRDTWPTTVYDGADTETTVCDSASDASMENNMCFRSDVLVSTSDVKEMFVIESGGCPDHINMRGGSGGVVADNNILPTLEGGHDDDHDHEHDCTGACTGGCCGAKCDACSSNKCCAGGECSSCSGCGLKAEDKEDCCAGNCCSSTCAGCLGGCTGGCDGHSCGGCGSCGGARDLECDGGCTGLCGTEGCYAGCCASNKEGCYAGCCASNKEGCCAGNCCASKCTGCGSGCGSSKAPAAVTSTGKYDPTYQHYTMMIPQDPGTPGEAKPITDNVVGIMTNGVILDSHEQTWSYDQCNGHSDKKHQYHYHTPPTCFLESMGFEIPESPTWWMKNGGGAMDIDAALAESRGICGGGLNRDLECTACGACGSSCGVPTLYNNQCCASTSCASTSCASTSCVSVGCCAAGNKENCCGLSSQGCCAGDCCAAKCDSCTGCTGCGSGCGLSSKAPTDTCSSKATVAGEVRPYDEMSAQWPSTGKSPVVGWARDGFPIKALYDSSGALQRSQLFDGELDECNGKDDGTGYAYYLTAEPPFAPPCLKGTIGSFTYAPTTIACPKDGITNTVLGVTVESDTPEGTDLPGTTDPGTGSGESGSATLSIVSPVVAAAASVAFLV